MDDLSNSIILIVDDTEMNIDILVAALGNDYNVRVALDGETALEAVDEEMPDLILLDIMMPKMDGYEVCRRLKADEDKMHIPVIFLTALNDEQDEAKGLQLGAVDYVTKPFNPHLIKARVRNHLLLKQHQNRLEELVRERTRELALTQEVTIESMGTLAEYRDPETGGHIKRTQNYMKILAEELKKHPKFSDFLTEQNIDWLYKSAPLHDIGKVAVPDSILLKAGKLNDEEFEEMKKHTIYGRNTIIEAEKKLGYNSFLKHAREIAYYHHEKWDGTGYPQGIRGEDIPISARLMAVADIYDALISKRVYKPPFPHSKAKAIMLEGRGSIFDPDVLDAFIRLEEQFREVALKFADFEEERAMLDAG